MKRLITITLVCLLIVSTITALEPSKRYVAKLNTSGGQISAQVLENTFDGTLAWTRIEEGRYRVTLADAFDDENKVIGLREWHFTDSGGKWRLFWDDETESTGDSLMLESHNSSGVLSDGILSYTEVSFGVYD